MEHVEFRLPKNQWLIHRRICSLPDRWHLLHICIKKMRPSANETIRLDINHWFFGRRFLIAIFVSRWGAMPRLNILMSHRVGRIWCLKTIGFHRETRGIGRTWSLKTIGLFIVRIEALDGSDASKMDLSMLKSVCQRTNGWCTDGFVLCQTDAIYLSFLTISCIRLPMRQTVCSSTIGSFADGFFLSRLSRLEISP